MKKLMGSETCRDTVLARSLLAKIAQCPVTGGRPTAMTRKQFEAACAFHQERNRTRCRNAPFAVRYRWSTTAAPCARARCGRVSCAWSA